MSEKTRIQISKNLWAILTENKKFGESHEDVILRLIMEGKAKMVVRIEETEKLQA